MSDQQHYKTACSSCHGRIEFPAAAAGTTIRCPHCGAATVLTAPAPAPPAPAADGTLKCPCVHCGGNIAFPAAAAGSTVNCPHCGQPTKLAAAGTGAAVQDGIEAVLDEISAQERARPKKKKPTQPGAPAGKGKVLAIVGGVVALLAIAGVAGMKVLKRGKAAAGPKAPERDLEVVSHQLQRAKDGGLVYVIGVVTNHSDQQYFRLNIEFGLTDKEGKELGTTSDYTGNLAAHGTWDFKAIVLESSTAQAKLVHVQGEPESGKAQYGTGAPPPAPAAKGNGKQPPDG